jgi:hypothetical protein
MSTSAKKIAANRLNGQKSHGPTNTTSTRFNATKHGLLAIGITELDDAEGYRTILRDLIRELKPVGLMETFLVRRAAVDIVRWPRATRFEAEYITGELNPPIQGYNWLDDCKLFQGPAVDPGLPAAISFECVQKLILFRRYESSFAFDLFRTLHELERLQRMRKGESLPAPATVDVNIHADPRIVDSVPAETGTEDAVPVVPAETGTEDAVPVVPAETGTEDAVPVVPAETGTEDAVPMVPAKTTVDTVSAALGPKVLPGDEERGPIAKRTQ